MEEGERKVETPMLARMSYRAGYACQRVRVIDFGQLQRMPGGLVGRIRTVVGVAAMLGPANLRNLQVGTVDSRT